MITMFKEPDPTVYLVWDLDKLNYISMYELYV